MAQQPIPPNQGKLSWLAITAAVVVAAIGSVFLALGEKEVGLTSLGIALTLLGVYVHPSIS